MDDDLGGDEFQVTWRAEETQWSASAPIKARSDFGGLNDDLAAPVFKRTRSSEPQPKPKPPPPPPSARRPKRSSRPSVPAPWLQSSNKDIAFKPSFLAPKESSQSSSSQSSVPRPRKRLSIASELALVREEKAANRDVSFSTVANCGKHTVGLALDHQTQQRIIVLSTSEPASTLHDPLWLPLDASNPFHAECHALVLATGSSTASSSSSSSPSSAPPLSSLLQSQDTSRPSLLSLLLTPRLLTLATDDGATTLPG